MHRVKRYVPDFVKECYGELRWMHDMDDMELGSVVLFAIWGSAIERRRS